MRSTLGAARVAALGVLVGLLGATGCGRSGDDADAPASDTLDARDAPDDTVDPDTITPDTIAPDAETDAPREDTDLAPDVTASDTADPDAPDLASDTTLPPLDLDEGDLVTEPAGAPLWGLGVHAPTIEVRAAPGAAGAAIEDVSVDLVLVVSAPSEEQPAAAARAAREVPLGPIRLFTVPPPPAPKVARPRAWSLPVGRHDLGTLVAWEPGRRSLVVDAQIIDRDTRAAHTWTTSAVEVGVGLPAIRPLIATRDDGVRLAVRLHTRPATPLGGPGAVGLTLDGASTIAAHQAELDPIRAGRALRLKVYQGARRYLVTPGCESVAACAPGGAKHPCVTTCACDPDDSDAPCDFSGLGAAMRDRALGIATRVLGRPATIEDLAAFRIHYVFKRSFGGSAGCDENGEIAASPGAWAAFSEAVMDAAHAVNVAAGAPAIDFVSPMNEANHPLQDGAHVNAAGQSALGGLRDLGELAASAGCGGTLCCAPDRYLAATADVVLLTAAALQGAARARARWVAAGDDPALFPEPALSLFMDTELVDPFLSDATGAKPPIVTPPAAFLAALGRAVTLERAPALALDTYPGSWGAPWYDGDPVSAGGDGAFVLHYDAAAGAVVRADPVAAADLALTKLSAATDAAERAFGQRPAAFLGEVGWSVFDLDLAAQAVFVTRLFAAAAAHQADDPGFRGLLWFKDSDRATPTYPTWTEATFPGLGTVACDAGEIGAMVCTLGLLDAMDGAWGLFPRDDALTPRPAWSALLAGLASTPRMEPPR